MTGIALIGDTNANTAASGDVGAATAYPTGTAAGDLWLIPAVWKPATQTAVAVSGYTATTHRNIGATGAGVLMRGAIFHTILGTATPAVRPVVTPGGTSPVRTAGFIVFRLDDGWTYEITDSFGSDTVSDTTFDVTGGTVLPFDENDWLVLMHAVTANLADYQLGGTWANAPTGSTFNTLDSKWHSGNAAGTGLRSETLTSKCNSGPASAAPRLVGTLPSASTGGAIFYRLHPVHKPAHALGIGSGNFFKLQAARDGAGAVFEETHAQLVAGYYESPYFICVDAEGGQKGDQDWVRYQVRCDGPNTGGTAYARSELREMGTDGTTDAAWNSASGQHRIRDRLRWPSLPSTKPTIVGLQIHDNVQDNLQVTTQKNATSGLVECKLRINGTSTGRPTLDTDYRASEENDVMVDITSGVTRVWWNDMVNAIHMTSDIVSSGGAYFKSGCYANFDETDEAGTTYAICEHEQNTLAVWHTGYAGSAPAPLQLDQPTDFFLAA